MAMKVKTPSSMRRPAETGRPLEQMPAKPKSMRPETLSQVPKELGWQIPETSQRGGPRRIPVPTELKRKSKVKAKKKPGDVYVNGKRTGNVLS
jgi:hypothetical protein